jgi:hypothetical protein
MFRQIKTTETIPFKLYKTGEPIFASDYNLGRNGFAYFDNDTADFHGNTGTFTNWNQGWSYRNDGVDIEACTDSDAKNGFSVGWTGNGEWMEYTVIVDSTAAYTLDTRSASGSSGSKVHLEADGKIITPQINLPGTSGWYNWRTTTISGVILEKGTRKVRFVFDQGGSNLNYFKFSNPVNTESITFQHLRAESSKDGKSINISLNKPVTSETSAINIADFTVTINNIPIAVSAVSPGNNQNSLLLQVAGQLFYGGAIKISYSGNSIYSNQQPLTPFSNAVVENKLPVRYNLPGRIQSENFSFNNGLVIENCTDAGGGYDMGYAAPGDYLDYLVYVPDSGNYKFNFRVASERSSSQLIIRIGEGNTFTAVDTVTITTTGGWQTWKTISSNAVLPAGRYTMRIYIRSGEFNTNWFEAAKAPITGILAGEIIDFQIYPNPASNKVTIEMGRLQGVEKIVTFYNSTGQIAKSDKYTEQNMAEVDISDLKKGFYFVEVKTENGFSQTTKLVVW